MRVHCCMRGGDDGGAGRPAPIKRPVECTAGLSYLSKKLTHVQVVVNFRHITEMENHGVNRTDINKFMEAGYCTVESVRESGRPYFE